MSTRVDVAEQPESRPARTAELIRTLPFAGAALVSLATAVVLLPVWVFSAVLIGGIATYATTRATSSKARDRAATGVSIALGLAVGPTVFLLLSGFVAIVD